MFMDNRDFYPTPMEMTKKMFDKLNIEKRSKYKKLRVLEPSAGKGDLIENFKQCWVEHQEELYNEMGWRRKGIFNADDQFKFDCIEIDTLLQDVLRGKNYNVIHNDFLTFDGNMYDLILANFPFSDGVNHLLHAIKLQERLGGQIICLINAETLKNTYSNNRKQLVQLLEKYNADIEYIENGFMDAERTTNVTVAMIYINVPMADDMSMFEREFKRDNPEIELEDMNTIALRKSKLEQLVFECDLIKKSVGSLFLEKLKVEKMLRAMGLNSGIKICEGTTKDYDSITVQEYYMKIDLEYWEKFISETDLLQRLPSKLRDTFRSNMSSRSDIPFTLENAFHFYEELVNSIPKSYEQTCSEVFDKLTLDYHYSKNEWCKNMHLFNGWKTNDAFKIGSKVIIPYSNYGYMYELPYELTDLIIIFENISGIRNTLPRYERHGENNPYNQLLNAIKDCEKDYDTQFFTVSSFKKGTLHLKFKDMDLVEKFNIIVSKFKQWLPPSFGEKAWSDMNEEEQNAIISFGIDVNSYALYSGKQDYLRLMA